MSRSCPRVLDVFGTELADDNGLGHADAATDAKGPKYQADWLRWLHRSDGVVLLTPASKAGDFGPAVRAYFDAHFAHVATENGDYIYRRRSPSGGLVAQHRDARDHLSGIPAEVVGEGQAAPRIQLSIARFAA